MGSAIEGGDLGSYCFGNVVSRLGMLVFEYNGYGRFYDRWEIFDECGG
jgi:hypothetical protein